MIVIIIAKIQARCHQINVKTLGKVVETFLKRNGKKERKKNSLDLKSREREEKRTYIIWEYNTIGRIVG